jgi:hypothetical protein
MSVTTIDHDKNGKDNTAFCMFIMIVAKKNKAHLREKSKEKQCWFGFSFTIR